MREDGSNTKYTKLERGELPWGAPFGYKHHQLEDKRKTVISSQPKAQVVREIHIRYSTGAYSCRLLAREISQEYGVRLTASMVNRILRDKFYIGIMTDKKTDKEYPHFYEHLVSDDVFERNQEILDGNYNNRKIRYAGLPSVYRGLIHCSLCGCVITPEKKRKVQKNGNVHEYYYYHCTNAKRIHKSPVKYITENKLNEYVMDILKNFKMSEEKLAELQNALNEAHENKIDFYESKRKEIIAKRKQLSNRKQNMYDLLADKCITPDEYNKNNARYDEELSNLRRLEEKLDNADNNFYISVGYLLSIFQNAEKLFEVANTSEKRQIVSLILSNLQLDDEKLIFNLKEPFDKLVNLSKGSYGWDGGIRTPEWRDQNPLPYHLATSQCFSIISKKIMLFKSISKALY